MGNDWWTSQTAVNSLANALVDAGYLGTSKSPDRACRELLRFYDRPWRWNMEWDYFQAHKTMDGFEGTTTTRRRA